MLDVTTVLVAAVGEETSGSEAIADLSRFDVDTRFVVAVEDAETGRATVFVAADGENCIVVEPGANHRLTAAQVLDGLVAAEIGPADVLLSSAEIPLECVQVAVSHATAAGAVAVHNLAPAHALPEWLDVHRPILIANAREAQQATGASDVWAAASLLARRCRAVLVTLGAAGVLLAEGPDILHIAGQRVDAVDTTGAGDAFCGALAALLAQGWSLPDSARGAVKAGAVAVTARGSRGALARLSELQP